ncbi:GAF modulated sigma54 specific transcriptional regulator, Fis family [Beijerinckia indica subsp. indica ATCC 9039]|uniref:GAF modulated sigma54 specific transcriptional regulator, Fis family n=2 Tax=Beijerinckia TaxID=532 RepID=B2IC61_BEII9|nr:GAF modulated sigma54 specific transcriptional regulator, Fis family [Beijerinckia indica subsp. indica ATCC 9039]
MGSGDGRMPVAATAHAERIFTASFGGAETGDGPVGSLIIASWRRCLDRHKLDPERQAETRVLSRGELREAREPLDALLSLSTPLLDDLYRQVADLGYVVMLTDGNGITLNARAGNDERAFRKWGLWTGSVWSEGLEGTNGVGLCLTEQRPVTVHRGEHFRSRHAGLTCTVAPLFNADGTIIGCLDISAFNQEIDSRIVGFAQRATTLAAGWIEAVCFRHAYRSCWIVSLGESIEGKALLAFDEDRRLKGASRLARQQLGLDEALIDQGIGIVRDDGGPSAGTGKAPLLRDGAATFLSLSSALSFSPPLETRRKRPTTPALAPKEPSLLDTLAGDDRRLQAFVQRIRATAGLKPKLLITGETGTGKEVFARAIHGDRVQKNETIRSPIERPFIRVDCRALLNSQDYPAQNSFAQNALADPIERAAGGTLFLDEIGDLPLSLQAFLVHALDNHAGLRGEGASTIALICATQQDLEALVTARTFRADLYYRLKGLPIDLPPLRSREDKSLVIDRLVREIALGRDLSATARSAIEACEWPGNLRQLRQVLELAFASSPAPCLESHDFDLPSRTERLAPVGTLQQAEKDVIARQLAEDGFDIAKAASHLGMSRATLYRRIKHFGLGTGR